MIQDAKYTSPSGKETTFDWEIGKRKTELKTGVYTFPGRDGAHVQHQGAGARSFPLTCIFSGDDCMSKADAFEAMLIERGIGELQHPTYGTIKVVPTGDIEREDDPVNRFGESIVTITFTETITDEESGDLTETSADAIEEKREEFEDAAVSDFAESLVINNAETQSFVVSSLKEQTSTITKNIEPLAMADKRKLPDWITSAKEIRGKINNLYKVGESYVKIGESVVTDILGYTEIAEEIYARSLDIARLTLHLMTLPSTLSVSFAEKMKGFGNITANLINQYKSDPFGIEKMKAAYATVELAVTGACASIASSAALTVAETAEMTGAIKKESTKKNTPSLDPTGNSEITSREAVVEIANNIINLYETTTAFLDEKIKKLNLQDTENSDMFIDASPTKHLALSELVHLSAQLILNASFSLPMQKTITLDRDRQVIELCAELYGSTDFLDDFIVQNNFNIDEIELLPMGKKVSYYVKSA